MENRLMADLGAEGNEASKVKLIFLARDMAERKGIDPALVCGLIEAESAWEPWAVKYEPGYKWLYEPTCAQDTITESDLQCFSWGLMQIMGAVARERGLKGWLTRLLQPEVNLSIGIKHLIWLAEKDSEADMDTITLDVISAWNQGSPRKQENGEYVNQAYVRKVLQAMKGYQT